MALDVYRLKLATGNITSAADYMEMTQLALQAGIPAEAKLVVDKGYSVRETERIVARELNPPVGKESHKADDRDLFRLEEDLSDAVGATVKISANRKGAGSVMIRFGSLDQLDGLIERMKHN